MEKKIKFIFCEFTLLEMDILLILKSSYSFYRMKCGGNYQNDFIISTVCGCSPHPFYMNIIDLWFGLIQP